MILGARRKQALFTITVDNIVTEENKIVFLPNKTLKHSNTHRPLEPLIYQGYPLNEKLCIVNAVQCYLGMRENLVGVAACQFFDYCILTGRALKLLIYDFASSFILNF